LYYIKYSTWKGKCIFLEDIIVTEAHRKAGIGKKLFDEVVKVAKEMKAPRMEWQVLEWNEPAIKFYEKLNARFDNEWINCKLTGEQIEGYFAK
jgi:GNAT superfamily N-acetyltransferase